MNVKRNASELPREGFSGNFLYKRRFLIFFLLTCGVIFSALSYLFRALWFDEVLTMEVFVHPMPLSRIYWAYNIPNNHIIYTLAQKLWVMFLESSGPRPYFLYRMVSLAAAVPAVYLITTHFLRKTSCAGVLTAAALCLSTPFLLFATSIRGYMFSFLFCTAAFLAMEKWVKRPSFLTGAAYFFWCLLAVGTIPANLAALGAGVGFFLPTLFFRKRKRLKRLLFLAFVPFITLFLFYFPIARKFFANMDRGEGWTSPAAAAQNLYFSFFAIFIVLIPFAVLGGVKIYRKYPRLRWNVIIGLLIFLVPTPAFFVFKNAAFPRVFFPLFPIWAILIAYGFAMYVKSEKSPFWKALPFVLQLGTTLLFLQYAPAVSDFLFISGRDDDLLMPYHLRHTFTPQIILQEIRRRIRSGEKLYVYSTFHSDAPAVAFQVLVMDLPQETVRTDVFGGFWEKELLERHKEGYRIYFITGNELDLQYNIRRFGLHGSEPILIHQYQRLDRIF
ncbi:MAG: hypothetical protein J6A21_10105 [Lentisphaeria bacterium]|nr:hypothetical protein [Lentisphaeria bacterium]